MMDIYLFGTNNLSRILTKEMQRDERYNIIGVTANREYVDASEFYGFPLVPFEDLAAKGGRLSILNCVCYSDHFSKRKLIDDMIVDAGCQLVSYIHPEARVCEDVEYGEGCVFMGRSTVLSLANLGRGNIVWDAFVGHDVSVGDYNYITTGAVCAGGSSIGNNCFIGINSAVNNHVRIASNTTVGGGVFVRKDTEEYEILAQGKPVSIKPGRPLEFDISKLHKYGNRHHA